MFEAASQAAAGASGGMGFLGQLFQPILQLATGQFKGRPQWRDLQFMNDAQNRLWPDEIKRQGDFLTGLAPSQAAAHNTFQDATYQQGIDRQTAGIKSMASGLGMSPWELTGQSGSAAQLPADPQRAQGGEGAMPAFLSALVPLMTAQIHAKSSLQQTAMQTDAQRDIAGQATAGGRLPQAHTIQAEAQAIQAIAAARLTGSQEAVNKANAAYISGPQTAATKATTEKTGAETEQARAHTAFIKGPQTAEAGARTNLARAQTDQQFVLMAAERLRGIISASPHTQMNLPGMGHVTSPVLTPEAQKAIGELTGKKPEDLTDAETQRYLRAFSKTPGGMLETGGDIIDTAGGFLMDLLSNKKWGEPGAYLDRLK